MRRSAIHDPVIVDALRRDLLATPEPGRDALLNARLHELRGHRSSAAVRFLADVADDRISGVGVRTLNDLADTLHPATTSAAMLRVRRCSNLRTSSLGHSLRWRDHLHYVSALRDRGIPVRSMVSFSDPVLTLGVLLALDTHLPREAEISLHRSAGEETVFLFGAALAPWVVLGEKERTKVITWPRLNQDTDLARWALANPALAGRARAHVIAQNTPSVIAELRADGTLTLLEVMDWLAAGDATERTQRIHHVLPLADDVPGSRSLRAAVLRFAPDLSALTPGLSVKELDRLSDLVAHDLPADTAEAVRGLLPTWTSTATELRSAASALAAAPSIA